MTVANQLACVICVHFVHFIVFCASVTQALHAYKTKATSTVINARWPLENNLNI